MDKDITNKVKFELNDDECLPLIECVCGKIFTAWDFILGMGRDSAGVCSACGRKMYFTVEIKIFEKIE